MVEQNTSNIPILVRIWDEIDSKILGRLVLSSLPYPFPYPPPLHYEVWNEKGGASFPFPGMLRQQRRAYFVMDRLGRRGPFFFSPPPYPR